jgi:uncharacterized membrane protein
VLGAGGVEDLEGAHVPTLSGRLAGVSSAEGTQYNELSGRSTERLQALADGVFAVAMTLLVLDVRLPDVHAGNNHELWSQLVHLAPRFAAYLLSFTMLGTFWLAVHALLEHVERSDRMLSWAVLTFLFFVSTLPFAASTLAGHVHLALAVGVYWLDLAGLGATIAWQIWHVDRAGLVGNSTAILLLRRRLVLAQSAYAVAALVSLLSPPASIVLLAVFQLFFVISPRLPFQT